MSLKRDTVAAVVREVWTDETASARVGFPVAVTVTDGELLIARVGPRDYAVAPLDEDIPAWSYVVLDVGEFDWSTDEGRRRGAEHLDRQMHAMCDRWRSECLPNMESS